LKPTAIVTGGSRGIGRAIVEELVRTHTVVATYNSNREAAEAVAAAIAAVPNADTDNPMTAANALLDVLTTITRRSTHIDAPELQIFPVCYRLLLRAQKKILRHITHTLRS